MLLLVSSRLFTLTLLVLLVPVAAACAAAPSATVDCARYAAPGGDDSDPGTSARPFRTPDRLAKSLRPGQTGCLRGGTYRAEKGEDYVLDLEDGGRPGAPITVRSAPGARARLRGVVVIDDDADHVVLENLWIEGYGDSNTVKVYGDDVVIQDSDVTNRNRGESCFILGSDSVGPAERTVIRRNYIHDCGKFANDNKDHAIYAAATRDGVITENLIVNPAAYAIQLYPDAQRTRFARNVIDGGRGVRGGVIIASDRRFVPHDNVVERNVIAHAAAYALDDSWKGTIGTGNVMRQNCVHDPGEGAIATLRGVRSDGNIVADPGFRNRARRDYRLSAGSRCRSLLGVDVAGQLTRNGIAVAARSARRRARRA